MSKSPTPRRIEATATREGKWWFIELPEFGTGGQARTVKEIQEAATEVAALWLDVENDEVDVQVTINLPDAVREAWQQGEKKEAAARTAVKEAAQLKRDAVRALRAAGVSLSDTGILLGLSTQRVHQLAHDTAHEKIAS